MPKKIAVSGKSEKPHKKGEPSLRVHDGEEAAMPRRVQPMLATLSTGLVNDERYGYEVKWDGYRIIAFVERGTVRLDSRGGKDYTTKYPPIVDALKKLGHDAVLDGEIVVFDDSHRPSFNAVQLYNGHNKPIEYYVFDILWLDGYDLKELTLTERKNILKRLIGRNAVIKFSESFENGEHLYEEMRERGWEGVVAKRKDSPYIENDRGANWLKFPVKRMDEFVIGGWAESEKARSFRSILFGAYDNGKLRWLGRSGGGYKEREMPGILKKLKSLETESSPFVNEVLDTKGAKIHWVKPRLVANFGYAEMTESGRIRKPATWLGFRDDKRPTDVIIPIPKTAPTGKASRSKGRK
jgi:bifunctional non-homologous end joining protein LigD